ncbi:MAG: sialidase family protein [Verrucomicrobiales bacterium]|nr:sialidase family protein [Verrucomicrobiales bacterium]
MKLPSLTLALVSLLAASSFSQDKEVPEGPLAPFLNETALSIETIFEGERFPNIVVTTKGTVLATWGNSQIRARRSEDGGKSWGEEIVIAKPGFQGGGTTVDETTGDILAFVEDEHPPAPLTVYRSRDDGLTWTPEKPTIKPNSRGDLPSMHMNEHGITLRHGKHAGRLIRPTRFYGAGNRPESIWHTHYTNAMFSDDGGKTWQTSEPFPENGTGEATIAELSDGRLYYNSRVHWQERPKNTRRREAWSNDGGLTWTDFKVIDILPDGHQHRSYGCMGGLVRLPVAEKDILIFSNIDTEKATRERATVWASFDGGKSWPVKRLVFDGPSAYSSLNAGRPGTPSEGWIYLNFESEGNSKVARFNLSWLLEGEATGDGEIPNLQKTTVFEAGQDGYKVFRIPAVIKAPNGDLLAFCEARQGGDASEIDLVLKRSSDGGKTWGPIEVVQENEDFRSLFGDKEIEITIGNPAPVVDLLDPEHPGRIWLPFNLENDRVFVIYSDNSGKSWSPRREITKDVKKEPWGWYATGPVHSIQIQHGPHKGRLVIPCDHRLSDDGEDRGPNGAHAVLSDDHGKTWRIGALDETYEDGLNANETTVVELDDGSLYFNTRDQNGKAPGTRGEAWSRDGGETFESGSPDWQAFRPVEGVLDLPVVQGALLRAGKNLLLFSGPDENGPTGKGRSDLRIRYSTDEAKSWKDGPLIHTGPAAYSDMVRISDHQIGVLFESGEAGQKNAYQRIQFITLNHKDIPKDK